MVSLLLANSVSSLVIFLWRNLTVSPLSRSFIFSRSSWLQLLTSSFSERDSLSFPQAPSLPKPSSFAVWLASFQVVFSILAFAKFQCQPWPFSKWRAPSSPPFFQLSYSKRSSISPWGPRPSWASSASFLSQNLPSCSDLLIWAMISTPTLNS